LGENITPDLSIQDGKKRFGGFGIVFMGIRAVTDNSGGERGIGGGTGFGLVGEAANEVGSGDCAGKGTTGI
jgi:hypothetical protein